MMVQNSLPLPPPTSSLRTDMHPDASGNPSGGSSRTVLPTGVTSSHPSPMDGSEHIGLSSSADAPRCFHMPIRRPALGSSGGPGDAAVTAHRLADPDGVGQSGRADRQRVGYQHLAPRWKTEVILDDLDHGPVGPDGERPGQGHSPRPTG